MRLLAVNYHYYRTVKPISGIHPISPERFAEQISQLSACWDIVSESRLLGELGAAGPTEGALCLITFDDGLKEQMPAIRWLISKKLSALCYVPTAPLIDRRVLDVHKIHIIRTLRPDGELAADLSARFGPGFTKTDWAASERQYPYDCTEARQVKYFLNFVMRPEMRSEWLNSMFDRLVGDEASAAASIYFDRSEIRELAKHGMLGTHGHSHAPLASLNNEAIRSEIGRSLDIIKDVTGVDVRGISYPYGGPTAVNEAVGRIAAECGLTYGLTMRAGVNEAADCANPMLLRRIDTNDVSAFVAQKSVQA